MVSTEIINLASISAPRRHHSTLLPHISTRTLRPLALDLRIETKRNKNQPLPHGRNQQSKSRPHPPIRKRAGKTSRKQRQQEQRPPIPSPIPPDQQPLVDQQIHPRGRRHGRRDLRHLDRPCHRHLRARRKRQQRNDPHGRRPLGLDDVPAAILQRRGREDQRRLDGVADEQPQATAATDRVAHLAHDQCPCHEQAEADADVVQREERGRDAGGADGQQDRVARLVGREAVVVGEGGGVLDAGCESQEEEFGFDEGVDPDGGREVGEERVGVGSSSLHFSWGCRDWSR